jgi:hypothetical protein
LGIVFSVFDRAYTRSIMESVAYVQSLQWEG